MEKNIFKNYKIVFDMDDTLANFNEQKNSLERFATEKDFFTNLKPSKMLLRLQLALLDKKISPKNIYIVSASPNEQADYDKLKWLDKYISIIPKENIMFSRIGGNKATLFMERYGIKDLSSHILIDDYTKNLVQWKNKGGKCIKYINDFNNTKQHYIAYGIPSIKA